MTADVTTVAAAIVTVVVALAAAAVTIITALGKMKTDLLEVTRQVASDMTTVKTQVDGMTTAAKVKAATDADTIADLRRQLGDKDRARDMLAQTHAVEAAVAASQTPISIGAATPAAPTTVAKSLDNIDENTKSIDKNTRATRADVNDMKEKS